MGKYPKSSWLKACVSTEFYKSLNVYIFEVSLDKFGVHSRDRRTNRHPDGHPTGAVT